MNISNITNAKPSSSGQTINPNTQMGKDDFLRLLTVQLRYQDPLNPLENTEFIAQMAQFSSLEQLQNMNQSLEKSMGAETQLRAAFENNLATSLIGKSVEIPTWEIGYDGEESSSLGYRLGEGAQKGGLQILDARGQLVRQFEFDSSSSYGSITWDGRSDAGKEVPAGAYRVLVYAEGAGGTPVGGAALKSVRVEAVRYDDKGAKIRADGRELSLSDLRGVVGGGE